MINSIRVLGEVVIVAAVAVVVVVVPPRHLHQSPVEMVLEALPKASKVAGGSVAVTVGRTEAAATLALWMCWLTRLPPQ